MPRPLFHMQVCSGRITGGNKTPASGCGCGSMLLFHVKLSRKNRKRLFILTCLWYDMFLEIRRGKEFPWERS